MGADVISGFVVEKRTMALERPYEISYERVESAANVFVELVTAAGVVARGCAAPDPVVTGEDAASVLAALDGPGREVVVGSDPWRYVLTLERLRQALPASPAARAAVDMALYDLLARLVGVPLYRFLGGYRERMATSATIGILPADETVERARELLAAGFRCLKLKGGRDVEDDIERVHRVRRAAGPDVEIRFDANQGYSFDGSVRFVEATREDGLELFEQPTARDEAALLKRVTEAVHLPVMADESLMSSRDAFRLAGGELVDMVNVKLMKVGGLREAMRVSAIAQAAGLEIMVGSMDESALATAAGLAFALSRPSVVYADLDGHLDLLGDPYAAAVTLRDGYLYPNESPGLGWG